MAHFEKIFNTKTIIAATLIGCVVIVGIGQLTGVKNRAVAQDIFQPTPVDQTPASAPAAAPAPVSSATPSPVTAANQGRKPSPEQDKAVLLARQGQYDQALEILGRLYLADKSNQSVARDYATVQSWAGHDQEAVDLYEKLPAQEQQHDYVLAAIGHSYRKLNETDKALAVYRLGRQLYPDNVVFTEGEIRCLADQGQLDEALTDANDDLAKHGNRAEIVAAKNDVVQAIVKREDQKAVELARDKHYAEALAILQDLHTQHPDDVGVTRDYLAVLGWAGGHDQEVIALYKNLPEGDQPDYVLEAVAKAYRNLHQTDNALAVYRQGLQEYPDSVVFAEGNVRTLMDANRFDEALTAANEDIRAHGARPEIVAAKRDIEQARINAARNKATRLAREGHYDQALAILDKLQAHYPHDANITRDRIAVLDWAGGHDEEVVTLYTSLRNPDQPDYVLEAVGHAYRNLGKQDEALAVYERGLKRSPKSEIFAVGIIRCLTDQGYVEKAVNFANDNLKRYGNRLDVLLAAAYAADQYNMYGEAMGYYETASRIAPTNTEALQGQVRTSARMGKPEVALKIADEHPGLVPADEYRHLEGDIAANMVREGMVAPSNPEERFTVTDHAIAYLDSLIAKWSNEPDAQKDILRARFDRMLALHNRSRMQEVVEEYNDLRAQGVEFPTFVLGAVGDAYLDLHQPEKARDLYLQVLVVEPQNYAIRRQLFYAYVDCNDFKDAYRVVDQLVQDQPMFEPAKGNATPQPNYDHQSAELLAGSARLFAGQVAEADKIITQAVAAMPESPSTHEALGNLYDAHGWPRKALAEYQAGEAMGDGQDIYNQIGIANTQLQLQHFREAEAETQSLAQTYPENLGVQRAEHAWDIHNSPVLYMQAGYDFEPDTSTNVTGGEGYHVGATLYSQPFDYNWRLYAGELFAHQREPNAEGNISLSSTKAGLQYANGDVTAEGGPTYNHYHDSERVGATGDVSVSVNDQWTVAGSADLFSATNTPLRALNAGTTADFFGAHAVWQQDESRSLRFGGELMPFSDGNFRSGVDADYTQRLWDIPNARIDGLISAGESQNTANEDRPYYNPSRDFMALVGAQAVQVLYQRYSTMWQHSLRIMPGAYWEQHYGESAALKMRYEHRVFFNDVFDAGLGVNFSRQAYDGAPENDVSLTMDVAEHF